jgi:hypothetical protein
MNGAANTGGGGGGGGGTNNQGGAGGYGGSGIVIVRYPMNPSAMSISSNGISQVSTSGVNILMGRVGIGTGNPAEQLHVAGNVQIDGALKLGGETKTSWSNVTAGLLSTANNLSALTNLDLASVRSNLGLGTAATNDTSAFMGSQLTGITVAQVAGALAASNNLSELSATADAARANLGALSATGGVVNGSLNITGSIAVGAPAGDIPMGVYTNQ